MAALRVTAQAQGSVPVRVTLVHPDLKELSERSASIQQQTQTNAKALLAALGDEALPEARHISPLGSMDMLVTYKGLELLQQSPLALTVNPGDDWHRNILLPDLDGSLAAIDVQLNKQGFAMVDVTLDVEGAEHDIDPKTGQAKLVLTSTALQQAAQSKAQRVLEKLGLGAASGAYARADAQLALIDQQAAPTQGRITLKADRRALHELARNPDVLAIKPVGHQDPAAFTMDPAALETASKTGWADVIVQLRMPFAAGHSSNATRLAQTRAQQRMLDEVLAGATLKKPARPFTTLGGTSVTLSAADLQKLVRTKDARLSGVVLNRALFQPSLAISTKAMNLESRFWVPNYLGTGQTIIVFDTGIEKEHVMFKKANGSSKVVAGACFQTSGTIDGTVYQSNCSNPVTNAGGPLPSSECPTEEFKKRYCSHGTHVAGIAAGIASAEMIPPMLKGVAPDVDLISINIFSKILGKELLGINGGINISDLLAALEFVAQYFSDINISPVPIQRYVVNMSLGGVGVGYPNNWTETAPTSVQTLRVPLQTAVNRLKYNGIPVVAAMGNDNVNPNTGAANNNYSMMHIPAAVPNVIKVGAVDNTLQGLSMPEYANRVVPELWPGEYIFLAPGGEINAGVRSALAYDPSKNASVVLEGTSMSTPHVAGVYALLKSAVPTATVNDVSNFLATPGNTTYYNVTAKACSPLTPPQFCNTTSVFKALRF